MKFMKRPGANAPVTLPSSIRALRNLSAGFCDSWQSNRMEDGYANSEEAFEALDHIQNEILRCRDDRNGSQSWSSDPLKQALDQVVGKIVNNATSQHQMTFDATPTGSGTLPANTQASDLKLGVALNKLKHRSTSKVNFSIDPIAGHTLYIFTNAGCGQPATVSQIPIKALCDAASNAANVI
ncbi:hypothetical protein JHW46_07405 [Vibrio splendidus]|nr:hypothetical protein [Vibrio splendidus]